MKGRLRYQRLKEMRAKVIVATKGGSFPEIVQIGPSEIIFGEVLRAEHLQSLKSFSIYFFTLGKWNEYITSSFDLNETNPSSLKLKFDAETEKKFSKDFLLARC